MEEGGGAPLRRPNTGRGLNSAASAPFGIRSMSSSSFLDTRGVVSDAMVSKKCVMRRPAAGEEYVPYLTKNLS